MRLDDMHEWLVRWKIFGANAKRREPFIRVCRKRGGRMVVRRAFMMENMASKCVCVCVCVRERERERERRDCIC